MASARKVTYERAVADEVRSTPGDTVRVMRLMNTLRMLDPAEVDKFAVVLAEPIPAQSSEVFERWRARQ